MFCMTSLCSAALIGTCANDGECTVDGGDANAVCDTGAGNCVCASAYKDDEGTCVAKGLNDPCSDNADCADVTNANCNTNCVCEGQYKVNGATCVSKVLTDTCAATSDCANVGNAICDTTCKCDSRYKESSGSCVDKVLTDTCAATSDCVSVTNAICDTTCKCDGRYKESSGSCVDKALGDSCSADGDCAAVTNANCNTNCVCEGQYKTSGSSCAAKVVGDTCSANSDCSHLSTSECNIDCECSSTQTGSICESGSVDVPLLNEAFDLLKDSAFEYHISREKVNLDYWPEDDPQNDQSDSKSSSPSTDRLRRTRQTYNTFLPKEETAACKKLSQVWHKHQQALESLQEAITEYQELDRKCLDAYTQMNIASDKFNEYATADVDDRNEFKEAGFEAHNVYIQRTKEYIMYKEKCKMAFEKIYPRYKTEKQIREERLNKLDKDLKNIIETEMRETLTEGMKTLIKISTACRFSPDVIDRIESFDCAITAEKLYKDVCLKYCHPAVNEKHLGYALGNSFYIHLYFYVMDKDERRFRQHESCISLLDGEAKLFRREELYVWANSTLDVKGKDCMLKLKRDINIKQKFCSADVSLAFGWTRKFVGGNKHYGFYSTNDTRLVR